MIYCELCDKPVSECSCANIGERLEAVASEIPANVIDAVLKGKPENIRAEIDCPACKIQVLGRIVDIENGKNIVVKCPQCNEDWGFKIK